MTMDITYLYPQVLPIDREGNVYEGFVVINGQVHAVALTKSQVWCDWEVIQGGVGLEKISSGASICRRLDEVVKELSRDSTQRTPVALPAVDFYQTLVAEIEELGWDHVSAVNDDVTKLTLTSHDPEGHPHHLQVTWDSLRDLPTLQADLPSALTADWRREGRLGQLFRQFEAALERGRAVWRQLDSVDAAVWVLEPEKPGRSDVMRRIAVGDGASLRLELDPLRPLDPPRMQFLGPESVIARMRERANAAHDSWIPGDLLVDNLRRTLQTEFPSRKTTALEDVAQACGVCYAFNLDGSLPTVECANANCHQLFHPSCIFDWLRTLPSTRHVFNSVHGECPYCAATIVTSVMLEK